MFAHSAHTHVVGGWVFAIFTLAYQRTKYIHVHLDVICNSIFFVVVDDAFWSKENWQRVRERERKQIKKCRYLYKRLYTNLNKAKLPFGLFTLHTIYTLCQFSLYIVPQSTLDHFRFQCNRVEIEWNGWLAGWFDNKKSKLNANSTYTMETGGRGVDGNFVLHFFLCFTNMQKKILIKIGYGFARSLM